MKGIRTALSVAILLFLTIGYAASQFAYFEGMAPKYAQAIDASPIKWVALFFLIICIVFAFIADPEANEN